MNVHAALEKGSSLLKNPKNAAALLGHVLKLKAAQLYLHFEQFLSEEELKHFERLLRRKEQGEPLETILGSIEFYDCKIQVTSAVLIPRQETEILLDLVCQRLSPSCLTALDLCCGSGCLAIGLKKRFPHLKVFGVDISEKALEVARQNAALNETPITFLQGDLIEPVRGFKFDLVLCNPPYISEEEFKTLSDEVRLFEPKEALVSGGTGYEFYERISKELPTELNERAQLYFEIGRTQKKGVLEIFSSPYWKDKKVEKDWAGHDRFFSTTC